MAFELIKSLSLTFICFLLLLQLSDDLNGVDNSLYHGPFLKEISNRKLLMAINGMELAKEEEEVVNLKSRKAEEEDEEEVVGWELRAAPLGPDPLHHHGSDPKKPRTP